MLKKSIHLRKSYLIPFIFFIAFSQKASHPPHPGSEIRGDIMAMFYNVENLFDTTDDPKINDEEFLPDGNRKWNDYKYHEKLKHLFKVIAVAGGTRPPEIVGFAEIENREVLEDLVYNTPLAKYKYDIVHYDSPDLRGIDVGLIYLEKYIRINDSKPIRVRLPGNNRFKTRDILYVKAEVKENKSIIHIFVNHWPSRRGGKEASSEKRIQAARTLKTAVDSIYATDKKANVMIMGDFNDTPVDQSLQLLTCKPSDTKDHPCLVNGYTQFMESPATGTLKYKGMWEIYDQILLSPVMLRKKNSLFTNKDGFYIFDAEFLLIPDEQYMGLKPFRTYNGYRYANGFSDHLPVYVSFNLN